MKKLALFVIFLPVVLYSQSRNATVRQLNAIIDYMDECSFINRELYWDIKQFGEGYIRSSNPKRNDNYWWTHSRKDGRVGPFDNDRGRFPELHVDGDGMVSDFEYVLYPALVARENMDKLLSGNFFKGRDNLKSALIDFKATMDSLMVIHRTLFEYVSNKSYLDDPGFKTAVSIIDQTSQILDNYYVRSVTLYSAIVTYYNSLPVLNTQKKIIAGKAELDQCRDLIDTWADELYRNVNNTTVNDTRLHDLNDASLAKDSELFYGTYGYGVESHGAMPHTRYTTFYGMMKSTLYWYAKDRIQYPVYMTKRDVDYNEFVDRIQLDTEDYNDYIECSDGKQLADNLQYSMKMAAGIGVDTNQNVQLKWARKSYLFHFVNPGQEKPETTQTVLPADTLSDHQLLINKSSPHHMLFLLDVSASMSDPGKLDLLKEGAKYLVGLQRPADHISLLTFSTHSSTLLRNVSCDQKSRIYDKIEELHTHGATNASEGLRNAFNIADSSSALSLKNKIILVTDGKFTLDGSALKLLGSFKKKSIQLIVLLVGAKGDESFINDLKKVAQKGNGRFYSVDAGSVQNVLVNEASD